ncbi:hypothetical protein F5Y16DRAFT_332710 [Xylariaceae sp. FL0255]|nr:hypothetical protein F5Y16DRAFT_332710 [Xylariaceae sp. FL0255]
MVRIAIAGGSGQVAREIIDVLALGNKHEILVLSRGPSSSNPEDFPPEISWQTVNYDDTDSIAGALKGIHTVLSFVQLLSDAGNKSQKNLIDACVRVGVKRFAPSEWGSAGLDDLPWWRGKQEIRECLARVNEKEKVLEYTLFQPGLFLEYLASPYKTAKHLSPLETIFDFQNRRAVIVDGHEDAIITLTSVHDLAEAVATAVNYNGEWPVNGGIAGNRLTVSQVVAMGERIRGHPFAIERVKIEDLEKGELKTSWMIGKRHAAVKEEEAAAMFKTVFIGMLLSTAKGAWDISGGFGQLLKDLPFVSAEDYLSNVWNDAP